MHNSCTTALEATVSEKPIVTYIPFQQRHGYQLPNELGYCVETKEELLSKVNNLFVDMRSESKKILKRLFLSKYQKKYILIKKELAAEKMIKIWESLAIENNISSKSINWIMFKLLLRIMKFNGMIRRILGNLSSDKIGPKKEILNFLH